MRPYLALWAAKIAASLAALEAERGGLEAPPFGGAVRHRHNTATTHTDIA